MRSVKSCGVLVLRGAPPEAFLLMVHPDRLDLPKGHLDPGESEIACALRELREEAGLTPADVELDPQFRFVTEYVIPPPRPESEAIHKTLVIFLARLVRPAPIRPSPEHQGFVWQPWRPPHRLQARTIDPLLAAVEQHLAAAGPA